MESCTTAFDLNIGNSICPITTTFLLNLFGDDIKIIDINEFKKKYSYDPCISSRFMVTKGGSCNFTKNGYNIMTHNGTLQSIEGMPYINNFMALYP